MFKSKVVLENVIRLRGSIKLNMQHALFFLNSCAINKYKMDCERVLQRQKDQLFVTLNKEHGVSISTLEGIETIFLRDAHGKIAIAEWSRSFLLPTGEHYYDGIRDSIIRRFIMYMGAPKSRHLVETFLHYCASNCDC